MTVLVSIPVWNPPPGMLRRAVDAVLGQTHGDLMLMVVRDGGDSRAFAELDDIHDPRLTIRESAWNRGRYAVDHDAVAAAAGMGATWWAPHDVDDVADPEWLAAMVAAAGGADAVFAAQWVHHLTGAVEVEQPRPFDTRAFAWRAHMAGLWSPQFVVEHHLTNPWVRVGWDTVMTSAAHLVGDVRLVDRPLYHRYRRWGSLTTGHQTGMRSAMRAALVNRYQSTWRRMVVGDLAVADAAAEYRPRPGRHASSDLIGRLEWGKWRLDAIAAAELDRRLHQLQPSVVVEFGSGHSTLVLARYARGSGAHVVTCEHNPTFARATENLLAEHGYRSEIDLRVAPLVGSPPMYDTAMPDGIEFALIDGPPEALGGRAATFPALAPHLACRWEVWLDDAERPGETAALTDWAERHRMSLMRIATSSRSLAVMSPTPITATDVDASDVVVTILTGDRPRHLADTLAHLPASLLATATVIALVNGGDQLSVEVLRSTPGIDHLYATAQIAPMGSALSLLATRVADTGRPLWLHLEDDWRMVTLDDSWLDTARQALAHPSIGQVRLRHHGEPVLARHMVTGAPLRWRPHPAGRVADAHWTANPSLMRTNDAVRLFPASGEPEIQRNAYQLGIRNVVQLHPGVFVHSGDDDSLRLRLGAPL